MIGSHADVVLADIISKLDFDSSLDVSEVFDACEKLANTG